MLASARDALPESAGILATTTIIKLARYFGAQQHRPSADQWAALADLACALERMAEGTAAPRFYLSSLDPGVGKSQTLVRFVDALLASRDHEHVGVLLCVSRLSEVRRMVDEIGIPPVMLHVKTSDATLNTLGTAEVDAARVIITTQQMTERRLADRTFAEAGLFSFKGEPRAVRVWDEAFLPGQPLTLSTDDIAFVLRRLSTISTALRDDVRAIFDEVDRLPSGAVYPVPDFAERHEKTSLNDILGLVDGGGCDGDRKLRDDERAVLSALWFISGKTVAVRRDGRFGNAVLDYRETLPKDLAPMVILDASGRVRQTYRDMETERGSLVRLRTATKRYDPLTVHLWQTGGGKSAFASNGPKLAAGIAKTIDTKPNARWLVVCHRSGGRVGDVEKSVRELMTTAPDNVAFITWGSHSAINDYADVPNVILAGTLFYRGSYYEALKRLASGRPASQGGVSDAEVRETELGEHAHLILQALCRGSVRKSDGEMCQPCDAYVVASVRSGIPAALPSIFPGCRVVRWSPIPRFLQGHAKATLDYVERWSTTAKAGAVLPFKVIQRNLGVDKYTFKRNVRVCPPLIEAFAELGIEEWGPGRYSTGYRLHSPPLGVPSDEIVGV